MEIKKEVDPSEFQVGVVVARFQVNKLHEQQRIMLDIVFSNHRKVIIFLGVAEIGATRRNPLDFATRKAMVQKHYPTAIILPLLNNRSNEIWSKRLDNKIHGIFSGLKVLLYGSRDSFIPHYQGKFLTTELSSDYSISGTDIREKISREILESSKFRAGIIHSVYAKYDTTFPTVDICAYNDDGQILLARKSNENKWRFVGGFVDVNDISLERAAYREFMEEVSGSHISDFKYILSQKVNDWRYDKEKDGIMTTLFLAKFGHGQEKVSDDVEEVKWFDVSYFTNPNNLVRNIMEEHQDMMVELIIKIYKQNLVPNLGEFYFPSTIITDPNIVKPNKYTINL